MSLHNTPKAENSAQFNISWKLRLNLKGYGKQIANEKQTTEMSFLKPLEA